MIIILHTQNSLIELEELSRQQVGTSTEFKMIHSYYVGSRLSAKYTLQKLPTMKCVKQTSSNIRYIC